MGKKKLKNLIFQLENGKIFSNIANRILVIVKGLNNIYLFDYVNYLNLKDFPIFFYFLTDDKYVKK